jgi:hypothetical protein
MPQQEWGGGQTLIAPAFFRRFAATCGALYTTSSLALWWGPASPARLARPPSRFMAWPGVGAPCRPLE